MLGMRFLSRLGCRESVARDSEATESAAATSDDADSVETETESNMLKTVGWISAALGAVAIGLIVGREIRQRYKFNHRTPYDLYSHSGDELPDVDCGVGI
jgi:hypothetical protein